ncbi:MAG: phosphomethylpyrimidine synthase ThiC [Deltaproteobacteria bacterium]|nr:phosphomethylpyrimidine synthase ThiC [Deltaproteobacteria bacterium]
MTQLIQARKGNPTREMKAVAQFEDVHVDDLMKDIAEGAIVIPANKGRTGVRPVGIGRGLTVKVNANIGTSEDQADLNVELAKLKAAVKAGGDSIMDLSTGGDLDAARRQVLRECDVIVGTVPVYQAAIETAAQESGIVNMTVDGIFKIIERHVLDGVDFITVHCGLNMEALGRLKKQGRVTDIVSRGGAFLTTWMIYNQKENPLFEYYDRLLELSLKNDVTLSLGDGLRPGCLADASDRAQIQELLVLGELAARAKEAGVQVMIEGPGHVPLNQVEVNVQIQKQVCNGAPFYVLGPLVTDIATGHDHIACAIGGALAGMYGADFLCYVTPTEHLGLPGPEDVREGVIATKIAAHAADIARGNKKAIAKDAEMAGARKALDWEKQIGLTIDSEKAARLRQRVAASDDETCTMCGQYCAIKLVREFLRK